MTLKELMKKYRTEELAVKLNVSAATIYKWKRGSSKPSRLAQEKIDSILVVETSGKI